LGGLPLQFFNCPAHGLDLGVLLRDLRLELVFGLAASQ
jgi:hypothetical protein